MRVGDLGERLAGRRVLDGERPAAGAVAPLAADVELLGDAVEDRCSSRSLLRAHVATVSFPSSSVIATSIE